MAVTQLARTGLNTWGAGTDPFTRAQRNADAAALEAAVALYSQTTAALRPAAGKAGRYHYATDTGAITYDTGAAWVAVGGASYVSKVGGDTIQASGAGVVPLTLKGAASQTADLLKFQSSSGLDLLRLGPDGSIIGLAGNGAALGFINDPAATGASLQTNPSGTAGGALLVSPRLAGNTGLVVRGVASQTGDLLKFQNSSAVDLAKIDAAGGVTGTAFYGAAVDVPVNLVGAQAVGVKSVTYVATRKLVVASASAVSSSGTGLTYRLRKTTADGSTTTTTATSAGVGSTATAAFSFTPVTYNVGDRLTVEVMAAGTNVDLFLTIAGVTSA